uniref:Uncharacterized protein n=1 Tax=Trichuris muris TaxID=70415 RepID=A0A5S6QJA2_TRIMR
MEISNSPDISSQVSDGIDKTNGNNVTPILTEVINKEGEDKRLVVSGNRVTVDLAVKFHNSLQDALTLPPSENVSIPETKQLQVTYCSTNSSIDCSVDIDLTSEESEFHSLNALCPTGGLSEQKDAIIRLVPNKTAIIERRAKSLSPSRNSADACPVDVDMTVENSESPSGSRIRVALSSGSGSHPARDTSRGLLTLEKSSVDAGETAPPVVAGTGALVSTLDSSTNDCLESRPAVQSPSNATSHVEETGASSSLRMDPSGNDKLVRVQPNTNILSDPVLRNQSSSTDACPFCGIKRLTRNASRITRMINEKAWALTNTYRYFTDDADFQA